MKTPSIALLGLSLALFLGPAESLAESIDYQVIADGGKFHLNGEDKPALTVTRGDVVTFHLDGSTTASHPFTIGIEPEGGAEGLGIATNGSTSGEVVLETGAETPANLFYFCSNHQGMGNTITVQDPPTNEFGVIEGILVGKGVNNDWVEVREDHNGTRSEVLIPTELTRLAPNSTACWHGTWDTACPHRIWTPLGVCPTQYVELIPFQRDRSCATYIPSTSDLAVMPTCCWWAAIDRFKYASRKIVRWFGGAFILTVALVAAILAWRLSPLLLVIGVAVVAFAVLTGTRARRGPLAALVDMLIAYAATLQGVTKAMRGRTVTIWNPAQSR